MTPARSKPGEERRTTFPLVDRYLGIRLGLDLSAVEPGSPLVAESPRRLRREESYSFIHALWAPPRAV